MEAPRYRFPVDFIFVSNLLLQSNPHQVHTLSTEMTKLAKDVLASGAPCPAEFVALLREQLSKLNSLSEALRSIIAEKSAFPEETIREVARIWHQHRYAYRKD